MKKIFVGVISLILLTGCSLFGGSENNDELGVESFENEYSNKLICNNRGDTGHYRTIHEHYLGFDETGEDLLYYKNVLILQEVTEEQRQEIYDAGHTDEELEIELQKLVDEGMEEICNYALENEEYANYYESCEGKVIDNSKAVIIEVFSKEAIEQLESEYGYNKEGYREWYETGNYDGGFKGVFTCEE